MELHTYSSLTQDFIKQYNHTMDKADLAFVYYNHHALQLKRLPDLNKEKIYQSFDKQCLKVFDNKDELLENILKIDYKNTCLLMSSSGNFDGIDIKELANKIIK